MKSHDVVDSAIKPMHDFEERQDFAQIVLENLKTAVVQQAYRAGRIDFTSIKPWPSKLICAEGIYCEGNEERGRAKRAAIFVGSKFGAVSRPDLVAAACEAAKGEFDVLICCTFNYRNHSNEWIDSARSLFSKPV